MSAAADLVPPQPLNLRLKDETEAIAMAATNNPQVISAQFNLAAAKDAVDVAFAALLDDLAAGAGAYVTERRTGRQEPYRSSRTRRTQAVSR